MIVFMYSWGWIFCNPNGQIYVRLIFISLCIIIVPTKSISKFVTYQVVRFSLSKYVCCCLEERLRFLLLLIWSCSVFTSSLCIKLSKRLQKAQVVLFWCTFFFLTHHNFNGRFFTQLSPPLNNYPIPLARKWVSQGAKLV